MGNNPINNADPRGLFFGPIDMARCTYYKTMLIIEGIKCKKEVEDRPCEDEVNDPDWGFKSRAIWRECVQKSPYFEKMIESCGITSIAPDLNWDIWDIWKGFRK